MRNYTYELIGYKIVSNSGLILRFKSSDAAQEVRKSIIDSVASYPGGNDDSFKNIENMYTNANDTTIYFDSWDSRENFIRRHIKHEDQKIYYMTIASSPYLEFNRADSFTCTIDDINEEVRKMLMNEPYTFMPKTDATSIHISTAGYDPDLITKDFAKLRKLVVDNPLSPNIIVAPKEWTGEGYTKLFEDAAFRMKNTSFTYKYKEDKNLDRVIRKVQINEKKKVVTIVWKDGEVTMAKCGPLDIWDPEKGVLVCVAKRFFNSGTQFNKWLKDVTFEPELNKTWIEKLHDALNDKANSPYQPKHSATE